MSAPPRHLAGIASCSVELVQARQKRPLSGVKVGITGTMDRANLVLLQFGGAAFSARLA